MTIINQIMAGFIAALLTVLAVIFILNANLRADLAVAKANTQALDAANHSLQANIQKQNSAIAELNAENIARSLSAAKAIKAATIRAKHYAAQAAAIANPATADDCAAAKQILRDYFKNQK